MKIHLLLKNHNESDMTEYHEVYYWGLETQFHKGNPENEYVSGSFADW